MEYEPLGSTGIEVSRLCFGTARFGMRADGSVRTTETEAYDLLDAAWEHGINFIDTANKYGDPPGTAEKWVGNWLSDHDREDFVVASKVSEPVGNGPNDRGLSRKHIRRELAGTLERLGTDYVDIYYIHRWDEHTPIAETMATLERFVDEGKILHLGVSMMAAWQLTKALYESRSTSRGSVAVTQPRFNAIFRDQRNVDNYLDVCADQGLAVCPYAPLEGGLLTGKYTRGETAPGGTRGDVQSWDSEWEKRFSDRQWRVVHTVEAVAEELGVSESQVALQWLLDHDRLQVFPVVGTSTVEQVAENAASVEVSLSADQHDRITDAYSSD